MHLNTEIEKELLRIDMPEQTPILNHGLLFKIDLFSAISFKRSRRELSIDVAEQRSILKNYQNRYYPSFILTLKTGKNP